MWYKNDIWCDSETDTDEDELPDYMELMLGTNINGTDSDSDGLPDYYESHIPIYNGGYMITNTTLRDTDGDSLADGEEILISRQYIPMTSNVRVSAIMRSAH